MDDSGCRAGVAAVADDLPVDEFLTAADDIVRGGTPAHRAVRDARAHQGGVDELPAVETADERDDRRPVGDGTGVHRIGITALDGIAKLAALDTRIRGSESPPESGSGTRCTVDGGAGRPLFGGARRADERCYQDRGGGELEATCHERFSRLCRTERRWPVRSWSIENENSPHSRWGCGELP